MIYWDSAYYLGYIYLFEDEESMIDWDYAYYLFKFGDAKFSRLYICKFYK